MTRRVVTAMTVVTVLGILIFALPLAVAIEHRQLDQDRREVTRLAALAATRVDQDQLGHDLLHGRSEPEQRFGLYDDDGVLVDGNGPRSLERPVRGVLRDRIIEVRIHGDLVTAVPVVGSGRIRGAVRASEPVASSASKVRHQWARLAALALLASMGAAAVGWAVARRLVRPLDDLVVDATRLGDGDFTVVARASGLAEVDHVGAALTHTASRLSELIAREQALIADASHQLRSPVAALRITVEGELAHPRPDHAQALTEALVDIDRLERTIADFLSVARDSPDRSPIDLGRLVDDLEHRWRPALGRDGRRLVIERPDALPLVRASAAAVSHVLDVLVSNAQAHGAGDVVIGARAHHGALTISITDHGKGVADQGVLFQRRQTGAHGNGIGLALARRLAEAEGGRLTLRTNGPPRTTFEVTFPGA